MMAFDSRSIERTLPGPNHVGSVFKDDPEKLHSDLIDLDVRLQIADKVGPDLHRGGDEDEDDEDGFFKSLTESIASGKYSITTERKVSGKEPKVEATM
jgi:hypothetical protein